MLERDSEALGPARAATGLLGGGLRPAAVGDAVRRSGARVRARAQRASGVRLARAGRRPRGGRARGAAPAQLPARLRDRDVLHARRGLHALPRAQHAAGRAAELPRVARRVAGLRGVAGALAAAAGGDGRRVRRPERVRARPAARSWGRRWAGARAWSPSVQRSFAVGVVGRVGPLRAGRRAADAGEGLRRRDPAPARRPACRSWWPATGRSSRSCGRWAATCGSSGSVSASRAGAAAARGGAGDRAVALRRDPAAGRAGGDGGRAAGRRGERRRAGRGGAGRGAVPAGRRGGAGRAGAGAVRRRGGRRARWRSRGAFAPLVARLRDCTTSDCGWVEREPAARSPVLSGYTTRQWATPARSHPAGVDVRRARAAARPDAASSRADPAPAAPARPRARGRPTGAR